MATITLKFKPQDDDNTLSNFNSSLQVNDYVYYVKTNAEGSYTVNYNDAILVGAVKTITPPVKNIAIPVTIDRDHHTNFSKNTGSFNSSAGYFKLNTGVTVTGGDATAIASSNTFTFSEGVTAKVGDTVNFTSNPSGLLSSTTGTILSFELISDKLYYVLGEDSSDNFCSLDLSSLDFDTITPTYKKLKIPYTGDLSVGMFVRGGALSLTDGNSTTTITAINEGLVTLSDVAHTINGVHNYRFSIANTNAESIYYQVEVTTDLTLGDLMSKANSFFFFVKDTSVNTSGLLGYYADMKIELASNTTKAELFSVGTEMFESSK
jgi:hypothetical protein